ncbi:MAG: DUF3822 family protein [Bacteroidales bacterium]|nr:DUF3822 family protein [Bacteroidales bacterium]
MVSYFINNQIISENINSADNQKKLSICLETNGFSFTVTNSKNQLLAFVDIACSFPETLSQVIALVKQIFVDLRLDYMLMDDVELIIPTCKHTWVPESLFDAAHSRSYFKVLCPLDVKESVFYSYSEKLQAYSVFAYWDTIVSAFKVFIPGIKVKSVQTKMLETQLLEKSRMKTIIEVYVRKKDFDVAIFDNKNFVLGNSFKYADKSDIVYHILLLSQQMNISQDNIDVYISGKVDKAMYAYMEKFFGRMNLYTGKKLEFTDNEMYKIPLYQHSLLFR